MTLLETLLPEFDHEMAITRTLLERVPDDKLAWKPHEKSMSLAALASHLSNLPFWGEVAITQSAFDVGTAPAGTLHDSRAALLAAFDTQVATTRQAMAGRTDAELLAPWTLKNEGKTIFTMPKAAVLRTFMLNHVIHHRGQLSVYLRLNEVPLPSIYGPSADERPF